MNIICRKNQKLLSAFVDEMLPEKAKKAFTSHLESCPECRKALQEMELLRELLREFPEKHPGLGFETAILSRVREKSEINSLRNWSRRVSYGLAGLVLLLIVTLYIQKPVLPPKLDVVRMPSPNGSVVTEKKAELVPEEKPRSPVRQNALSGPGLPVGKDAERASALPTVVPESQSRTSASSSTEEKLKAGTTQPAPQAAASLITKEYKAVSEKEIGEQGLLQKTGGISGDKESPLLVIRNKADWEKAWNFQNTIQNLSLPLPEVDFKKQMVVVLPTNQAGREYKIVKTEEKPDRIIVQYRVTTPKQTADVIVAPYQIEVVNTRDSVELRKLD